MQNGRLPATALAEDEPADGRFIGANVRRIDAPSKVSGALKYAGDMVMPRHAAHAGAALAACRMRASFRSTPSEAEAMAGVEGVITCADVPGEDGFGVFVHDQPVMARGKVRYVGEAVAAVAAEDQLTARRALCEDQGACTSRCRRCSIPTRPCGRARRCCTTMRPTTSPSTSRSASATSSEGFAESDLIVEENYATQQVEHAYLEPEAGLAYVDHDGVVTIVSPSQNITHHRHMLAKIIAQADQQGALHHDRRSAAASAARRT